MEPNILCAHLKEMEGTVKKCVPNWRTKVQRLSHTNVKTHTKPPVKNFSSLLPPTKKNTKQNLTCFLLHFYHPPHENKWDSNRFPLLTYQLLEQFLYFPPDYESIFCEVISHNTVYYRNETKHLNDKKIILTVFYSSLNLSPRTIFTNTPELVAQRIHILNIKAA